MIIVLQISDINVDKTTYGTCWSYESFITKEVHQNPCKSNICGLSKEIGIYHNEEIYDFIKNEYPHLCDANYLCIQHCRSGDNRPEWKHAVRTFLENSKKNNKIQKMPERGFWKLR